MQDRVRRMGETYMGLLALALPDESGPGGRLVRTDAAPTIYDANLLLAVTAEEPAACDELLAWVEKRFADLGHRHVIATAETPATFTARLALAGYQPKATLQLLLEGPLQGPPPAAVEIRPIESDADWSAHRALLRRNHIEDCARAKRPLYDEAVTDQMLLVRRAKAPELRFWMARVEDTDCAYFSSWPGSNGLGIVEDLYTHPPFRKRGIARALIHHAVGDARARGAGPVMIGADPTDTPKGAYVALGFAPTCITWNWLRVLEDR